MYYFLGIILFVGLIWYFGVYLEKKQAKKVRKQILSGQRVFLAHWKYDNDMNLAEFQAKDGGLHFFKKNLSKIKEIYICSDGILLGETLFFGWKRYARFKDLKITSEEIPCILFCIEYKVGESENIVTFQIPIPKGKELEAVSVLDHLIGTVKYDY